MSIVIDSGDGVMRIAFDRDEAMNAFDMAAFAAVEAALEEAAADPAIRAIVLIGRGGRAFSAGFDIHEMAHFDEAQMRAAFVRRDPVMLRVAEHRCPVIAAIDGICYGAGALLALASDIRIATPAFRLKVTAVGYGGANATWTLPAIVGAGRAREILMTGRVVCAEEAQAIGLISRIVTPKTLDGEAMATARAIAAHPPLGIQGIKQLVGDAAGRTQAQGWQAEHDWMLANTNFASEGGGLFTAFAERHTKQTPSGEK